MQDAHLILTQTFASVMKNQQNELIPVAFVPRLEEESSSCEDNQHVEKKNTDAAATCFIEHVSQQLFCPLGHGLVFDNQACGPDCRCALDGVHEQLTWDGMLERLQQHKAKCDNHSVPQKLQRRSEAQQFLGHDSKTTTKNHE